MLGQKIKELRKQKGMSCSELARRAGHSVSTIHGIEAGANLNPRFKIICDIANVLGVNINYFTEKNHLKYFYYFEVENKAQQINMLRQKIYSNSIK